MSRDGTLPAARARSCSIYGSLAAGPIQRIVRSPSRINPRAIPRTVDVTQMSMTLFFSHVNNCLIASARTVAAVYIGK